jgi:molybdate/tungstate transport system ATP-binding protein
MEGQLGMIEADVKKRLGDFSLDANVSDEHFICLTGKNGSGKTTLLNLIGGLLTPDDGYVTLNSRKITNLPIEEREVSIVTPDSCLPHLDVDRHLIWGAKNKRLNVERDYIKEIKTGLGINFGGKVGKLSLGMRERVSLATSLVSKPQLILVDEAFSNIDNHRDFVDTFRDLAAKARVDVIFTTQYPDDSTQADHHYQLDSGKSTRLF